MQVKDTPKFPRYRTSGYGGMTESEHGTYVHVADMLEIVSALKELLAAGDYAVSSADDVRIMLRLGSATDAARAAVAKAEVR